MRLPLVALACALVLTTACSGDKDPAPTATAALPTATLAPTSAPPTPTPEPQATEPPYTIWLLDLEAGTQTTLYENADYNPYRMTFDPDGETVRIRYPIDGKGYELRVRYDGTEVGRGDALDPCQTTDDGAEIDGRVYDGVSCGPISPDGHWMTYTVLVDAPEDARQRGDWDQWVVDLQTGDTRLLQTDLRHCGGCDGRFGPGWSPDGRFLFFPELVQDGVTFISDMQTGITRELFAGRTEIDAKPDWSPAEDHLLVYLKDGTAVLYDPATDATTPVPALMSSLSFDPSGRYLYAPALGDSAVDGTTVYDVAAAQVVATLPGQAKIQAFFGLNRPLVGTDDGFVAAFQNAGDCEGVAVYQDGTLAACVPGLGPEISPDASRVALTDGSDLLLLDVATGRTSTLATGIESGQPARLVWSQDGNKLLVLWPTAILGP
jgi:hypothetical protein